MKKIYILFGVILLVLLAVGCTGNDNAATNSNSDNPQVTEASQAQPEAETAPLTILDSKLVKDEYGGYSVVGNATANKDLSYAEVDASFTDQSGALVGSFLANIQNIEEGNRWSFTIIAPVGSSVRVTDYNIKVGNCF